MNLVEVFQGVNNAHFDGFLEPPILRWNSRLRASAGRFLPGSRKFWIAVRPVIELASYLREEANAVELIKDTMAHEMIHYWLWVRRQPYGHTPEFWEKMTAMGVSRWNPVPRTRPYRYMYRCTACAHEFPARKRLGILACAKCCQQHAGGRFDLRFKLVLDRELQPEEGRAKADSRSQSPASPL